MFDENDELFDLRIVEGTVVLLAPRWMWYVPDLAPGRPL